MTVLLVGVDAETVSFLKTRSFSIEVVAVDSDFFLSDWINSTSVYTCLVINLDAVPEIAIKVLRKSNVLIPVVGLTYKAAFRPERRADFLEVGGDDLFVTPFHHRELSASINLCLRRGKVQSPVLEVITDAGKLRIDTNKNVVYIGNSPIQLTSTEFRMLYCLAANADTIVSKETIMRALYVNDADFPTGKLVDVIICKLRRHFREVGIENTIITTEWGRGYAIYTTSLFPKV